jgi:hypothetical protein
VITSSIVTARSFAAPWLARSAKMSFDPAAKEIRSDIRLEVGEGQDEIGLQCEDLVAACRCA